MSLNLWGFESKRGKLCDYTVKIGSNLVVLWNPFYNGIISNAHEPSVMIAIGSDQADYFSWG